MDWDKINEKKLKLEERRNRIFMRGVKTGKKRGGEKSDGVSIFELKDKKKG